MNRFIKNILRTRNHGFLGVRFVSALFKRLSSECHTYLPNCWSHIWVRLAAGSSLMSVRLGDRDPGRSVGLADREDSLSELDLLKEGQIKHQIRFEIWSSYSSNFAIQSSPLVRYVVLSNKKLTIQGGFCCLTLQPSLIIKKYGHLGPARIDLTTSVAVQAQVLHILFLP